jgi:hypothetical protein
VPRVLHLIKDPDRRAALEVVAQQARDPEVEVSVVLLQRAADLTTPLPGTVVRLAEENGIDSPYPAISHSRLLELIFAADTVVTW